MDKGVDIISELNFEKFGKILAEDTIKKLTGEHENFKRIFSYNAPSRDILIGNLDYYRETEDDFTEDSQNLNSLAVKFLVKDFNSDIYVNLDLAIYYRVFPTYEEEKNWITDKKRITDKKPKHYDLARIWKRKKVTWNNLSLNSNSNELNLNFKNFINEIKNDENAVKSNKRIPLEFMASEDKYNFFIDSIKYEDFSFDFLWDCKLLFNKKEFNQNDEDFWLIELTLVNDTEFSNDNLFEGVIFNPILEISLNNNELTPFYYTYSYDNDLKSYNSDLRCLNCHGIFNKDTNSISTKNFVTFNQEKVVPKSNINYADISFKTLSIKSGVLELEKISVKMDEFYNSCSKDNYDDLNLKSFNEMKERFKINVSLLKENSEVLDAFCLMNKTFENYSKNKKYDRWRLFQIVFIVSMIHDIVEPKSDRDTCELLHVMTGGGKSETYFGIVVFNIFWDRINGKKFGVTALTKFPLRMLSIQQLQRIANIFIHAEEVRLNEEIKGDPFSIAYYVGSQGGEFPRFNFKIINEIEDKKKKDELIEGKIINKCPLCGGSVYLDVDEGQKVVIHKCRSCDKIFRLYYSDDEIYRMIPTFIVSTVDKLAGIATNRRFKNLLGGHLDFCSEGHGFIPRGDICEFKTAARSSCKQCGDPVDVNFDVGPTLIIQDEMHLITEGFGTIDSHFESLIESMKAEFSEGIKFKNIAITATSTGAKTQIKHLYHKNTRIFPPLLTDSNENNFFFEKCIEDNNHINQRIIVGLKRNTHLTVPPLIIIRYISQFIRLVEHDIAYFADKHEFNEEDVIEIIQNYKKLLTYHNKKQDVHKMPYNVFDLVNRYNDNYSVKIKPLTGDHNTDYIKETINEVETFYENKDNKDKLFVVSATSIVSHGVDIDEWNVMIFQSIPRNTAEYIQALSRVGRKHFGIVFVIYDSFKVRDLSFYQNFPEYHNILEYKVEKVPLSRWTKLGFKQTFTSVFCASILNYLSNLLKRPIYKTETFKQIFTEDIHREQLISFIKKAYVSDSDMLGADFFNNEIENEINRRIEYMEGYSGNESFFPYALKDCNDKYFKTQFGMRGIQDEIILAPYSTDFNFKNMKRGK